MLMEEGGQGDGGKECSEVSKQYNIPGHSAPVPKSTCEHMQSCVPNEKSGVSKQLCVQIAACSHMCCLGQVWSGPILYCSETSEHSFPLSLFIPSLCLLRHLTIRHIVIYSTVDHNNDVCQSHAISDAQHEAQQVQCEAQQAQL